MQRALHANPFAIDCASDELLGNVDFMASIMHVSNIDWPLQSPRFFHAAHGFFHAADAPHRVLHAMLFASLRALRQERNAHTRTRQAVRRAVDEFEAAEGEPPGRRQRVG